MQSLPSSPSPITCNGNGIHGGGKNEEEKKVKSWRARKYLVQLHKLQPAYLSKHQSYRQEKKEEKKNRTPFPPTTSHLTNVLAYHLLLPSHAASFPFSSRTYGTTVGFRIELLSRRRRRRRRSRSRSYCQRAAGSYPVGPSGNPIRTVSLSNVSRLNVHSWKERGGEDTYNTSHLIARVDGRRQGQDLGDGRLDNNLALELVDVLEALDVEQLEAAELAGPFLPDVHDSALVPREDELALEPFVPEAFVESA